MGKAASTPPGRWILLGLCFGLPMMVGKPAAAFVPGACEPPPLLEDPIRITGMCPEDQGGPSNVIARGRDVFIALPRDRICSGRVSVTQARNIRISGGRFEFADATQSAVISIGVTSGTTLIDGLHINVKSHFADAIRFYRHTGRAIIQNTRIEGVGGTKAGPHGDIVHAQGGGPLSELVLQNVSAYTGYQGLFTPYRPTEGHGTHKLRLDRFNVAYDPGMTITKPLMLLYIGDINDQIDLPPDDGTTLDNVYVNDFASNFPFDRSVKARPVKDSVGCATFAPEQGISGEVCGGIPPGGDFAPAEMVGKTYRRNKFCN